MTRRMEKVRCRKWSPIFAKSDGGWIRTTARYRIVRGRAEQNADVATKGKFIL